MKWEWTRTGCYAELVRRLGKVDEAWWERVWGARAARWPQLGETLRRTECISAEGGAGLLGLYEAAVIDLLSSARKLPKGLLTAQMVDDNKGPLWDKANGEWSQTKTQKLSRFLAQWSVTIYFGTPPGHPEHELNRLKYGVPWAGTITDKVRAHNGAFITLSANPLDILDSSNHAGWDSCHKWWDHKAGTFANQGRATGNFCYVLSPTSLIAISHDQEYPETTKTYRQLVFVHDQGHTAALSRQYGVPLSEQRHELLRKMIAELLSAEQNPPWKWHLCGTGLWFSNTSVDGTVYTDTPQGMVKVGEQRDRKETFSHTSPQLECPSCGIVRKAPVHSVVLCGQCGGKDVVPYQAVCVECGRREEFASRAHARANGGWILLLDRQDACPQCKAKFGQCQQCGQHQKHELLEAVVYGDRYGQQQQKWCAACARNWDGHCRCDGCGKWVLKIERQQQGTRWYHPACLPQLHPGQIPGAELPEEQQLQRLREQLLAR